MSIYFSPDITITYPNWDEIRMDTATCGTDVTGVTSIWVDGEASDSTYEIIDAWVSDVPEDAQQDDWEEPEYPPLILRNRAPEAQNRVQRPVLRRSGVRRTATGVRNHRRAA